MLSEKVSREAYVLQPRGTALYADSSRFGTRMLKKMGWTEGKGLGPNQDGKEQFVRIKYRSNNFGLGFHDRSDGWTQHEESFNGFLNQIKSKNAFSPISKSSLGYMQLKSESLEHRSKYSRVRVHYQKFARQKDISQYSQKDLANIFGRKSLDYEKNCDAEKRMRSECLSNNKSEPKTHEATCDETFEGKNDSRKPLGVDSQIMDEKMEDEFDYPISQEYLNAPLCGGPSKNQNDNEQKSDDINPVSSDNVRSCKWEPSEEVEYKINTYNGIKFREVDLSGFPGSNITEIAGYSIPKNLKLFVYEKSSDTDKITKFCYKTITKRVKSNGYISRKTLNVSLEKEDCAPVKEMHSDRKRKSFNFYIGRVKKRKVFEKI